MPRLYFWIDLLSVLPLDEIALACAGLNGPHYTDNPTLAYYLSLLRLVALVRDASLPCGLDGRGAAEEGCVRAWGTSFREHRPTPCMLRLTCFPRSLCAAAVLPHRVVLLLPHLLPGHAPAAGHAAPQRAAHVLHRQPRGMVGIWLFGVVGRTPPGSAPLHNAPTLFSCAALAFCSLLYYLARQGGFSSDTWVEALGADWFAE